MGLQKMRPRVASLDVSGMSCRFRFNPGGRDTNTLPRGGHRCTSRGATSAAFGLSPGHC
jgi:hypothetical protein